MTIFFNKHITPSGGAGPSNAFIPVAEEIAARIFEDYCNNVPSSNQEFDPWSELLQGILSDCAEVLGKAAGPLPVPKAEETASALLRKGVSRTDVHATFKHVTVTLPHGRYRIFRETSGFRAGAVRILAPGYTRVEMLALTSDALAEFLLALDAAIPDIKEVAERLLEAIDDERQRRDVERKAGEIGMKTAAKLLEGLPALGVGCEYDVDGGTVHLDLTRMLTASLDIPLEELAAFVSDPGKILSVLSPAEAAAPCPAYREQHPFRWPPYGKTGGRRR